MGIDEADLRSSGLGHDCSLWTYLPKAYSVRI